MLKPVEAPAWFFGWISGKPYITTICGWTRKQVMQEVERSHGESWNRVYKRGGRIIKCSVRPTSTRVRSPGDGGSPDA